MNSIVKKIIETGKAIDEKKSTIEEIQQYEKLVDQLDRELSALTQEESLSLLQYLGEEGRDPVFGINDSLLDIIEYISVDYPYKDELLLMPASDISISAKMGTFDENFFTKSSTFTNKVIVSNYSKLLSKTKALKNVNEARFLASLIFYTVNEEEHLLKDRETNHFRTLLAPFIETAETWASEEKEGLRILGLLDV